jgi:hypothetical protein
MGWRTLSRKANKAIFSSYKEKQKSLSLVLSAKRSARNVSCIYSFIKKRAPNFVGYVESNIRKIRKLNAMNKEGYDVKHMLLHIKLRALNKIRQSVVRVGLRTGM